MKRDAAVPVLFFISNLSDFLLSGLSDMSLFCDLLLIPADIGAWYHTLLGISGTLWLHNIWKMVQINPCLKSVIFEWPQWSNFQDCMMSYVETSCMIIFLIFLLF